MSKPRGGTSYRLSEDAQSILTQLALRLGLTKTSVLELAIRKLGYAEFGPTKKRDGSRSGSNASTIGSPLPTELKS
jgi:hypothetical protein